MKHFNCCIWWDLDSMYNNMLNVNLNIWTLTRTTCSKMSVLNVYFVQINVMLQFFRLSQKLAQKILQAGKQEAFLYYLFIELQKFTSYSFLTGTTCFCLRGKDIICTGPGRSLYMWMYGRSDVKCWNMCF